MPDSAALLALPLAALAGALVLVVARIRALSRPLPPELDPRSPLSPGDRRRLRRWQRRLRRMVVLVVVIWVTLAALWWLRDTGGNGDPRPALALIGISCLLGAAIQFSERCPRCGYNLGFQSPLAAPERCDRCGGAYG